MGRFLPYAPEQAYLVPPSVKEELGQDHLCFFIHEAVEHLDLSGFEQLYGDEGGALYHPSLMLKVWLYAYALGITSARRLEQRIREDLGLRYLAGGAKPDNWALSAFRRRHARGLNDVFTQVLEMARGMRLGHLGQVAIDSTRIQAAASRNRLETEERLRQERSKLRRLIRKWQKQCDEEDPNEGAGSQAVVEKLQERLAELPRRLEKLRKSGLKRVSRTDPDARFLRERGGFVMGYTGEVGVNEDHLIVSQRVTQNVTDNQSLIPMVQEAEKQTGDQAEQVLADGGLFLAGQRRATGAPRGGCFSAGFESGSGTQHRAALPKDVSHIDPAADAAEAAICGGTSRVRETQRVSRTGLGNFERAAWHETVSVAGTEQGGHRVHTSNDRLQPHPAVCPEIVRIRNMFKKTRA